MRLDGQNQAWLKEFYKKNGRPPRILHIGNIANNAYNNAKLLNEVGFENHVICYDYYHIMGCPEWEDANFDGFVDDFFPNWLSVDLKGFTRPTWFTQGPMLECLNYLEEVLFDIKDNKLVKIQRAIKKRINQFMPLRHLKVIIFFVKNDADVVFSSLYRALTPSLGRLFGNFFCCMVMLTLWPFTKILRKLNAVVFSWKRNILFKKLCKQWTIAFPERSDCLVNADIEPYVHMIKIWRRILNRYDFVIGYSTDPIIPLVCGVPYFAFEHGTIRDIPYIADAQGRRTALAYHKAEHVFVTNIDCVPSAKTLASGKFTFINHPYDEDHGMGVTGFQELRINLLKLLDCEFLLFFPTRHDWVVNSGYADKANDVFLLAAAELKRLGVNIGIVCCEWGANVAHSKALIEREQFVKHVFWVKPLAVAKFEQMARACDLVVDQFKLGAFGGVVFKAMAVGAPVLTYLNESLVLEQYSELPPIVNCKTTEEIIERVMVLLRSPDNIRELGLKSREWIKIYHGKEKTINLQVKQFRSTSKKSRLMENRIFKYKQ